jgi:thiamine biosynthesis lipoprotein
MLKSGEILFSDGRNLFCSGSVNLKSTARSKDHVSGKSLLPSIIVTVVVIIIVLATLLGIAGVDPRSWFGNQPRKYSYDRLLMDTDVNLTFYTGEGAGRADAVAREVFAEMERLENLFSRNLDGSDICRINENAGKRPVRVDPQTLELIEEALHYAALSEGCFDITIGPLMDSWGFLDGRTSVPPDGLLRKNLSLVDYRLLDIDHDVGEVFLPLEGMVLDLGAIAKGYIVDRGIDVLKSEGIAHAFLNAGGDIKVTGGKPGGEPWNVGLLHPRASEMEGNGIMAGIMLDSSAIVTSGDYERYFEEGGKRYHHLLDPSTGFPAGELLSVTVVAPEAVTADALSTAIFVLGPARGMELAERLPGVEVFLVLPEMKVSYTSGLEGRLKIDPEFSGQ